MFVAAVVDCFVLTFRGIAGVSRFLWVSLECSATGTVDRVDHVTQFTALDVRARLTVPSGAKEGPERHLKLNDNRHRFSSKQPTIRLTFSAPDGVSSTATKVYEWSASRNDPWGADMRTLDKGKECLDYRSLLRVHLLAAGEREINLFPLFLNPLLAHYRNPASAPSLTFLETWNNIKAPFDAPDTRPIPPS